MGVMAQVGQGVVQGQGFEVRTVFDAGWVARRVLVVLVLVAAFYPWGGQVRVLPVVLGCVFALLQLFLLYGQIPLWRAGCMMRIDAAGVTVTGSPTVAWEELERVSLTATLVAFHPKEPGRELPMAWYGRKPRNVQRLRERLLARFGTTLVVASNVYGLKPKDFADAVRTYSGGLPVAG
jgi:hypothetical protein